MSSSSSVASSISSVISSSSSYSSGCLNCAFSDNFDRANQTPPGNGWAGTNISAWRILNNLLFSDQAADAACAVQALRGTCTNHYSQATVHKGNLADGAVFGVGVRINESTYANGYWGGHLLDSVGGDTLKLYSGFFAVELGSYAQAYGANEILKVSAVGNTIKMYRNGFERISVSDATYPTQLAVGCGGLPSTGTETESWNNFVADAAT